LTDTITIQKLRGLILSAKELKDLSGWDNALVEDYLTITQNIITLAEYINIEILQKIEEIPTDFQDGSIPIADSGFLVEDSSSLAWDLINKVLTVAGIITSEGRQKNTTRLTPADSPYNVLQKDENILADTDTGNITINLPEGEDGEQHKITNVGQAGNNAAIVPYGTEKLNGFNATENLRDSETFDLGFETTEGWWA
jgi:hypothetical protein